MHLRSWTIGEIKITRVLEIAGGGAAMTAILPHAVPEAVSQMPWLTPAYANDDNTLKSNIQCWIVATPSHTLMIDTSIGNDKTGRSRPHWNERRGDFLDQLKAVGHPAESVDLVICTHLHVDHVGWNTRLHNGSWVPTFKNARYLFGLKEYEYLGHAILDEESSAAFEDSVKPIVSAGMVEFTHSGDEPCEGVRLIATPGHSPGHMSVLVASRGENALMLGDVVHNPCQIERPEWYSVYDFDREQAQKTRRQLFDGLADTATVVFGGHFDPGRVVRCGNSIQLSPI
jgi:glyoxylase-like metal-dependent hydrolase (beta-lactamase superfamily II)